MIRVLLNSTKLHSARVVQVPLRPSHSRALHATIPRATTVPKKENDHIEDLYLIDDSKDLDSLKDKHASSDINLKNSVEDPHSQLSHSKPSSDADLNDPSSQVSLPWYLRDDSSSPLLEKKEVELPEIPTNAPPTLEPFLRLLANDYGLVDINLFDLTALPKSHPFSLVHQPMNYVILATGKSPKHIYKAASELRHHIKHTHGLLALMEGAVSSGVSPAARRRLLRRARKGPSATDNEYGRLANTWVVCNTMVDNIHIHMLTNERREELDLETVYCKEEDIPKYQRVESFPDDSDDIFIGIRRFHTSARTMNRAQKVVFDDKFPSNPSLQDYIARDRFYIQMHISGDIAFAEVEESILSKHRDLDVMCALGESEMREVIIGDIIAYTQLLNDSPAFGESEGAGVREVVDRQFDLLAGFISRISRFSAAETLLILDSLVFVPLLLRLTFKDGGEFIGANTIDRIIQNDIPFPSAIESLTLAANRLRDVLEIVEHHNKVTGRESTTQFRELVLHIYGHAGKWKKFWAEWESSLLSTINNTSLTSEDAVAQWVRLAVYLAARGDSTAMTHFFYYYWAQFEEDFKSAGSLFASAPEDRAFHRAVEVMLGEGDFALARAMVEREN